VQDGTLYVLVGSSEANRFGEGLYQKHEPTRTASRFLAAFDVDSGKLLWKKNAKHKDFIMPMGVALCEGKLYYHSIRGLGCLDAASGKEQWFVERPTIGYRYGFSTSTLVATPDVVLLADKTLPKNSSKSKIVAETDIAWGVGGWNVTAPDKDIFLERKGKSDVTAYSAVDGKELWSAPCGEGYNSPVDVFVVNELVWLGPFNKSKANAIKNGHNLRTGEVMKTIDVGAPNVGMAHDRCYRNKASEQFIFTCRDGIEVHDYEKGWIRNNSWTRGPCQFGIMPCNGLIYVPTDPCACHLKMRMPGFKSYSSQKLASVGQPIAPKDRLVKGPAFEKAGKLARVNLTSSDWPIFRHDIERSGFTPEQVEVDSKPNWTRELGGKLSQPVYAHGRVYVASSDQLTVYALDGDSGKLLWKYMASGTIDSSPTIYNGMLVFGSGDGQVHCVDASTGELVWRFRAAPEDRLVSVYGRLESSWPVHGSIIVKDDELCFTAGSNSYLGGGIYYYRLNPTTGDMLASNVVSTIDPVTERQTVEVESRFDSVGVSTDILSSDGEVVFLKHLQIDDNGEHSPATKPHLFSPTSLMHEEWFVRSYWTYAADVEGAGWGGWASTANNNPAARILTFSEDTVFGYGRVGVEAGRVGHRSNQYHLYSSVLQYERPPTPEPKPGSKRPPRPPRVKKTFNWSELAPFTVRAMVATPDKLLVAGVPDLGRRPEPIDPMLQPEQHKNQPENERLEFKDPVAALEAFRGERGAYLRLVSAQDGKLEQEFELTGVPVNDGMSVADRKLFISMKDGTIACYGR
jgi:outer membrane protein assembly factor BamB